MLAAQAILLHCTGTAHDHSPQPAAHRVGGEKGLGFDAAASGGAGGGAASVGSSPDTPSAKGSRGGGALHPATSRPESRSASLAGPLYASTRAFSRRLPAE